MARANRKTEHEPSRQEKAKSAWFGYVRKQWERNGRPGTYDAYEQSPIDLYSPLSVGTIPMTQTVDRFTFTVNRWRNDDDGRTALEITCDGVTFWDGPNLRAEREASSSFLRNVQQMGRMLRPMPEYTVPRFPKLPPKPIFDTAAISKAYKHYSKADVELTRPRIEDLITNAWTPPAPAVVEPYDADAVSKLLYEYGVAEEYHELCHDAIKNRIPWKTRKFGDDKNTAYAVEKMAAFFGRGRPWAWIGPEGQILRVMYAGHTEAARMFLGEHEDIEKIWAHVGVGDKEPESALRYVTKPTIKQKLAVKKFYREYVYLRGEGKSCYDV